MKKYILINTVIFAGVIIGFTSCKRDTSLKSPVQNANGSAFLRVIDASPNFRGIFNQPDSFSVFVNGEKITGFQPGATFLMTFGSYYPTTSTNNGYVAVAPGTNQIKLSVSGTVNSDSIPIQTFSKTFVAGQYYTFMVTDSITSARDSSQMFVRDNFVPATTGFYGLRFIHAIWNDTVGKNIDVWSTRVNRYIFTNVKPGTITSFTQYPYNQLYSDTFFVRRTGNPAVTLDTLLTISFSNGRNYTLFYRGNANSNSNADKKRRHLATYLHQ